MGEQKTVVIYHANCADGFASAWVLWRKYGDDAEYIPADYGDDPPDVRGRDVYIVDFSYKRDTLIRLEKEADTLVVYDHHKTAEADLKDLPFAVFDQSKSGAGLTWDLVMPGKDRPMVIDYVEDRDLWRWRLPFSQEINAYIGLLPHDFKAWDDFLEMAIEDVVQRGQAALLERSASEDAALFAGLVIEPFMWFPRVPVVNMSPRHASGALNQVLRNHSDFPFAVAWFRVRDGTFRYSLRSTDDREDVSEIAKRMGGGGHRNAAGFVCFEPPWGL